jgi:hypothetical protein
VCAGFTQNVASLNAAQGYLTGVETAGYCRQRHTIDVRTSDEWLPLHIARAHEILAARLGTVCDTSDGPLAKVTAGWSKEAGDRADDPSQTGPLRYPQDPLPNNPPRLRDSSCCNQPFLSFTCKASAWKDV